MNKVVIDQHSVVADPLGTCTNTPIKCREYSLMRRNTRMHFINSFILWTEKTILAKLMSIEYLFFLSCTKFIESIELGSASTRKIECKKESNQQIDKSEWEKIEEKHIFALVILRFDFFHRFYEWMSST